MGQCVKNSECDLDTMTCSCLPDFFRELGECREKIKPGKFCDDLGQCVSLSECDLKTNMCVCEVEYFRDGINCFLRLDAGKPCTRDWQCTKNATCDRSINQCVCHNEFFSLKGKCQKRILLQKDCDGIGQCIEHAECNLTTGQCECHKGFYRDEWNRCKELIDHGEPCEEDETCTFNSTCQIVTNQVKNCVCHPEFYVQAGKCVARIPAGQPCQMFETCVENAQCMPASATCECQEGYYFDNSSSGNCKRQALPGKTCYGPNTCVSHAYCNISSLSVCQCQDGYYSLEKVCKPVLEVGSFCNISVDKCGTNAECVDASQKLAENEFFKNPHSDSILWPVVNVTSPYTSRNRTQTICQCVAGFFAVRRGPFISCAPKKHPGELCWGTDMCIHGAECSSNIGWKCQCKLSFYMEAATGLCKKRILAGEVCSKLGQCVQNAECASVVQSNSTNYNKSVLHYRTCQCEGDEFFQSDTRLCQKRLSPGKSCIRSSQCVQNAECDKVSQKCTCRSDFYSAKSEMVAVKISEERRCYERRKAGVLCTNKGQCAENSECNMATWLCQCVTGYYNSAGSCVVKKSPGEACNMSQQCIVHATCQPGINVSESVCTCSQNYYADSYLGVCKLRLEPGEDCSRMDQCVQHAQCDPRTRTCKCSALFFNSKLEGE